MGIGWMDRYERREEVKDGIEYETLCRQHDQDDVDELVELIINEIKAPEGYVMDSPSVNVVIGTGGDTQTVVVKNSKAGSLVILKKSTDGKPLQGVEFKVTTSTGEFVPDASGRISSNGL